MAPLLALEKIHAGYGPIEVLKGISLEINQAFVGKTLPVLIEGQEPPSGMLVGRSYRDAPEIDGLVMIEAGAPDRPLIGEIVPVRITGAMAYDLNGVFVETQNFASPPNIASLPGDILLDPIQ